MSLKKHFGTREEEIGGFYMEIITLNFFIELPMVRRGLGPCFLYKVGLIKDRVLHLLVHATAFYKDLFGPHQISHTRLRNGIWPESECLNDEDREEMDKAFTEEEIRGVIDQMERNESAGPDDFPIEFY
jgi:hypothetical protein